MALPRIPSPDGPVVKPAVAEKSYPDKALMGIRIMRGDEGVTCDVGYQAYNFDTDEMSDDDRTRERFRIRHLLQEAAICPPLQSALDALINVLTLKYKQAKLRARIAQTPEGTQYDNLVNLLDDLEINDLQLTEREPVPVPFVEQENWAK